jgi:hypothetical protein
MTEVERGLVVKAKAPAQHSDRVRAELGKLPLASDVTTV